MLAIFAAFIWATYYSFIFFARSYTELMIFSIPSLSGSLVFIITGFIARRNLNFLFIKIVFLTGLFYFSEQFLIILSAEMNGSVVTALFILFGDAIIAPLFAVILRINTREIKYGIFLFSMLIMIIATSLLISYGNSIKIPNEKGILLLLGVAGSVPLLFLTLNKSIETHGTTDALAGTFFWPGLVTIILCLVIGPLPVHTDTLIPALSLIFTGITSMGIAYIMFFKSAIIGSFSIASVMQSFIPVFTLLTVHFTEGIAISSFSILMIIIASLGASMSVLSIREH